MTSNQQHQQQQEQEQERQHLHHSRLRSRSGTLSLLAAYVAFGVLHELAHLTVASWLTSPPSPPDDHDHDHNNNQNNGAAGIANSLLANVARAVLGRYSLVRVGGDGGDGDSDDDENGRISIISHAGWIASVILAVLCHLLHYHAARKKRRKCDGIDFHDDGDIVHRSNDKRPGGIFCLFSIFNPEKMMDIFFHGPILPVAAYITAMEAISTDLLGFTPAYSHLLGDADGFYPTSHHHHHHRHFICFCGNFGILLLNPSWLAIDGGRTALDILEKMINVTMMRGTL